ncbi:hypothetical protein ABWH96_16745 [Marivirga tractuosa]|uniref:hypothetical protein n=1 Tax=Marivirga tractuosa TaxID=1006 RepID=UPI0035D08EC7
MDSINSTTEFIAAYKDVINIIVGIVGGIFLSILTFLLTYRNNWRNKLTKELTVKLKHNLSRMQGEEYTEFSVRYYINNTSGHEISINTAYFILPKKLRGNINPNSTLGEMMYGTGRYYIFSESKEMKHHRSEVISIKHNVFLSHLSNGKIKKLRLYIETSRFGTVKSNSIKIKKSR